MSSTDTTTVEQKVFEALAALGTEAEITREASLEELDVDSLDLAEFAQIIDEDLGVRLEGKDLKDVKVVGDVVDLIAARVDA
ncbi:phosphopantetheine-binding protein [Svornostia abyssi]|uniref:Phosphopantetheine-binding protein n=1 Tax=Svornostia abyssi TaxID=2898438 RepID=A0ABY5PKL1_9ACTN|nr:phosphopantetheine-binding protein [Parviterribacteraceae bacterium J379]